MAYIEFKNVSKDYEIGETTVKALKKINIEIEEKDFTTILGPSGSGKTTILNIIGALDDIKSGEVIIDGRIISKYNYKKLNKYRKEEIGFIFKNYPLMENLTVYENILLGKEVNKSKTDVNAIIKKVGLTRKKEYYPSGLSPLERQKVALARALCKNPKILLCDEITGSLDEKSAKQLLKLLQKISKEKEYTIIMATHNNDIAKISNKVITIKNGDAVNTKINKKPKSAGDIYD